MGCTNGKALVQETVTLAILGLDNAGKTVTASRLQGLRIEDGTNPTSETKRVEFSYSGQSIKLYDLGGSKTCRRSWKNVLAEVYGIIFVVDSYDTERLEEAAEVFEDLLERESVRGKPVLVLANKQDKTRALDESEISLKLNLNGVTRRAQSKTRLERCSAISGSKLDKGISDGIAWLLGEISVDWTRLRMRVQRDSGGEFSSQSSPRAYNRNRFGNRSGEQNNGALSGSDDEYSYKSGSKRGTVDRYDFEKKAKEQKKKKYGSAFSSDEDQDLGSRSSRSNKTKSSSLFSAQVYGSKSSSGRRFGASSPDDEPLSSSRGKKAGQLPPLSSSSTAGRKKKSFLSRTGSDDDLPRSSRSTASPFSGKTFGGSKVYDIEALGETQDRPSSRRTGNRYGLSDDDSDDKYGSKKSSGSRLNESKGSFRVSRDDTFKSDYKYDKDDGYKSSSFGKSGYSSKWKDDYKSSRSSLKDDDYKTSARFSKDDDYKSSSRFGKDDSYKGSSKYGKDDDYSSSRFSSKFDKDDDYESSRFKRDDYKDVSKYGKYGDDYKSSSRFDKDSSYISFGTGKNTYQSGKKRSDDESDDNYQTKSKYGSSRSKYSDEEADLYGTKKTSTTLPRFGASETGSFRKTKDSLRLRNDYKDNDSAGSDDLKTPRKSRDWSPHASHDYSKKWGAGAGSGDSDDSGLEAEKERGIDRDKYSFGGRATSAGGGRRLAPIKKTKGTYDSGSRFKKTTSRFDDDKPLSSQYGSSRYGKQDSDDYRSSSSKWGMAEDLSPDDDAGGSSWKRSSGSRYN